MTDDLIGDNAEQTDSPATGKSKAKRGPKLPWKKGGLFRAHFKFNPGTEILAGMQYYGPSGDERWKFIHCKSDVDGNPRFVDHDGNIYPWRHIACFATPEEIIPNLDTLR